MTTFTINGTIYRANENNTHFYKSTGNCDKKGNPLMMRISKAGFEQAFDEYIKTADDQADVQEWQEEANKELKTRETKKANSDKQAEDAVNKKTKKPSKDIAFTGTNGQTLTAKQVDFLKSLQGISFWDDGINSNLWCDCIAMDTGWNPMSVGAMISTLREKGLIEVGVTKVNGRKAKFFGFTDSGKEIAKALGLH